MAYGQTGTGKTYTLGRLGEEDTAARGIMVRAMEDILSEIVPETDSISVSYIQVCLALQEEEKLKFPDTVSCYSYLKILDVIFLLEYNQFFLQMLQLYMETIQDLLDPANDNISISEDPKTGDVSLPGASSVEIRDQNIFLELLRLGEAHRFAANTKLNTESSRSHAILMVNGIWLSALL